MGVGDDCVVGKVDDVVQRLVRPLPAFTHKNTIYILFNYKIVELFHLIVNTPWIYIHHCGEVKGLK